MAGSRFDWGSVDWTKSNTAIAQELDCSQSLVSIKRKSETTIRAKRGGGDHPEINVSWNKIKWEKYDNATIARRLTAQLKRNISVQVVNYHRKKHAPDTVGLPGRPRKS